MAQSIAGLGLDRSQVLHTARVKAYPSGRTEVLCCDRPIFREAGTEKSGWKRPRPARRHTREEGPKAPADLDRAVRRARAQVRDIALCTPFRWFVTLTLDAAKVDRYNMAEITRKLNHWLDNQVRRRGLAYVLVPERHKDGAVHFHGFFNDALEAVDSGTISLPGQKRPRRPRSRAQREAWLAQGGHPVFNLPGWSLGFTTALELYGDYEAAVGYVCKYIGKDMPQGRQDGPEGPRWEGGKVGGRWYYSGGALGRPEVAYYDDDLRELERRPGAYRFDIEAARLSFVQVCWERGEDRGAGAGPVLPLVGGVQGAQLLEMPFGESAQGLEHMFEKHDLTFSGKSSGGEGPGPQGPEAPEPLPRAGKN